LLDNTLLPEVGNVAVPDNNRMEEGLDELDALGPHRPAVVLVGVQDIYLLVAVYCGV
jgi:hypothetical protein